SDSELLSLVAQGSYASAQTILARKIKKFPNRSFYHALTNQILHKQGKTSQAIANNLALLAKTPNDPQAVGLLYEFFDEFEEYAPQANQAYENVIKKYPGSDASKELLLDWFDRSVPKYDLKLYNKILAHLRTQTKDRRYAFWTALVYLQLIPQAPTPKEAELYVQVALRLVEPLRPFASQERYVYLQLLVHAGQYATITNEVATIKDGMDLDTQLVYLDALEQTQAWDALYELARTLLVDNGFDDFDTWKYLIKAGQQVLASPWDELVALVDACTTRNAALARVELALQVDPSRYSDAVMAYYSRFAHKSCCFQDLKHYLARKECPELREAIRANDGEEDPGVTSLSDFTRLVNLQKLAFYLEPAPSREFVESHIATNWQICRLCPPDLTGEHDINPVNELAMVAILLQLELDSSPGSIVKAIVELSSLLESDPYNHTLKLWLMKLHSNLNTSNSLMPLYQSLKIKMIQHETLGHYLYPTNPSKKHLEDLITIFRFYLTSNEEVRSSIREGFEKGTYSKLGSFISFGKRLDVSVSRYHVICSVLRYLLILLDTGYVSYFSNLLEQKLDALMNMAEFSDNRDFKIEWKVLGEPMTSLDHLSVPTNYLTTNDLKLAVLKYVLVFCDAADSPAAVKHLKHYNKILSSQFKAAVPFDDLLYKLTLNLLKLFKQHKAGDVQLCLNYLVKNLKFDKLKGSLIPSEGILSWKLSHNIQGLAEIIRIARLLMTQGKSAVPSAPLKPVLDDLVKELKSFGIIKKQVAELEE
ncbi:uncharacterized protein CANTADRAFT_34762, partial [Suhomyces tanzawaensis NRRL Y-17324]